MGTADPLNACRMLAAAGFANGNVQTISFLTIQGGVSYGE